MHILSVQAVSPTQISAFLASYEPCCVQLIDRFSEKTARIFCLMEDQTVCGIVFISKAGLVLHCFAPELRPDFCVNAIKPLHELFKDRSIYCISGGTSGTDLLVQAVGIADNQTSPLEMRPYVLMNYTGCSGSVTDSGKFIVQCTASQVESLYPLQRDYEIVEVLSEYRQFDEYLCRRNLLQQLNSKRVFGIADPNGIGFAAKATVSAVSGRYIQIGGVFTVPEYRNHGYASSLVLYIAQMAAVKGLGTVLFVKPCNAAARSAYTKAGFTECGMYKIVYY